MFDQLISKEKKLAVIGLGYVGLPLALSLAKKFKVIGFDINDSRIEKMKQHIDPSKELDSSEFIGRDISFTSTQSDLLQANFFIVAVPTPVDEHKVPDLTPVIKASHTVGKALKKGDYVVYESTVYPGCTEEDCVPILEKESGLNFPNDFNLGYSPERINPGDKEKTLENILKIVSGNNDEACEEIAKVYGAIIKAGIYKASSIKVAEAAKVIENTQRDINISFMNELSIIFDRMGINTREVLEAAGTKWNFLKFYPGLVGGHCIGVDPYYLLHKSKELGYDPEVILSGRRINDHMPAFIAKKLVQLLIAKGKNPGECKVLIKGITFKENVADIRNSKVADLYDECKSFSMDVDMLDPWADAEEVFHEYKIKMIDQISKKYDALILAVGHQDFINETADVNINLLKKDGIIIDLKSIIQTKDPSVTYWSL
ncbi:MAG TPA: nucleotide sugar dehydrogenase [Saprospiraceae bacterium]|nr:nucleotide sugar dehydrogenase [Saprospiraceae bacterium]